MPEYLRMTFLRGGSFQAGNKAYPWRFVKKFLGKLLFPRLQRDERNRRMNQIIVALTVGAVVAFGVGLGIWLHQRNHPF